MAKQFEFADFVEEFRVEFDLITIAPGEYKANGKWEDGGEARETKGGIMLPLSDDELRDQDNGGFTSKDRKVYVTFPIVEGSFIERGGVRYRIERTKDYSDYADVFIYVARGPKKP